MIPLALYIHFPWCVKKCPYCDFNSHTLKDPLPEKAYVEALLLNLDKHLPMVQDRPIYSIFMGGGTPSLFSADALGKLLAGIKARCHFVENIEITLEANPGTVESERFKGYYDVGINRLSLGIQSFNDRCLHALGRIHDSQEALGAIETVKKAGFTNFNLDLMFGLPQQTLEEGLADLHTAIAQNPTHLSWYELTLEPNTYFWHHPPSLPEEEAIITLHEQGKALLATHGFEQYEVSAYSRQRPCQHNTNYWEFGDYLAIGAGGHAKITDKANGNIVRLQHFRHPKQYMDLSQGFVEIQEPIPAEQLAFEYVLNALRLKKGVPIIAFSERTGLSLEKVLPIFNIAVQKGWLEPFSTRLCATPLGYQFLNNLVSLFLPEHEH